MLFGAGQEYINAGRQLGSFFSPGILLAILVMLVLSTWLIGSGFSNRKFRLKSFSFIKFFIISLGIFLLVAMFSLSSYVVPGNFKSINGINIPLNKCIIGSELIIPDKAEREKYCLCLADKITADSSLIDEYRNELENGQLDKIFKELQKDEKIAGLGFENCFSATEVKWTNNLANSMKSNWIKELEGTDFEQTKDIEAYCECLLNEYRKYPLSEILEDDFQESELAISIESNCLERSKNKN